MTASSGDMTGENSESVETRSTEKHVRIKTPDTHSPATGKCVCTTTGNECSPKDGLTAACAKSAAETDAVVADTIQADAAEASGGTEIQQNGDIGSSAWDNMEDSPFDKGEEWEDEIEAAYSGGKTVDTKDDDADSEDWETEIVKPCFIVPKQPYLYGKKVFLPADIHAKSIQRRAPSFHAVEGQFDDADDAET